MSKKQLTEFLANLDHAELKEQVIDLYNRFKNVKEFYDFSFNPDEKRRQLLAKEKISKEYFPEKGKKVKKRRTVAQKVIIQLIKLEANPDIIVDIMLFNIEVAQTYTSENTIKQDVFYRSMLKSFRQALYFIKSHYMPEGAEERIVQIVESAHKQNWINKEAFAEANREVLMNE